MRTFIVFILVFNSLFALAQPQIIFQDTLGSQPVGWKFRNSTPHDWRWYNNVGVGNGGGLRMKLPNDSNYVATSAVNLVAGQTYTLSFKARMDEGSTSRLVSVGYNQQQSWGGTSFIFSAQLPTDSYNTPPFTEYNPTSTVPQDGVYFFIFNFTQNGYAFTYMDEIVIERTIFPQTTITFPAQNASYNEGTDLTLTASASDSDGSVAKVEFFANGVKLGEDLTAPYEYQWINILPKDYQLITKATDNRGNVTTSEIVNVRMNFRDGSFGKYVHWDFDKSTNNQFDYWTLKNGDFKTRTGWRNTPCFEIFSAYANNFAASPGVYLRAGETYKLELLGDCSGSKNPRFYVNTSQELGGMLIDTIRITSNDNFNLVKTKTFSVSANGTYYLIINYPVADNYIQLKFDNIRIIGNLDIPPLSKMAAPDRNVIIAEKSSMKLRAFVESPENRPIHKIEYYANTTKVGESNVPPFEITWQNIPQGLYEISAKPFDDTQISAFSTKINADTRTNQFSAASYWGSNHNDDIRGAVFQKNGTIVMVANVGPQPTVPSLQLNNATDTTQGCVIRLASDGKSVLSVTRLAHRLSDIALDSSDNVYVGGIHAGTQGGFYKLTPNADTILWSQIYPKWVHRLDAGRSGSTIVLTSSSTNFDVNTLTGVTCYIYDKNGTQRSTFGGASQYTPDVAIDDATQTAIILGFKNFNTFDSPTATQTLPVFVPVIRGKNYDGTDRYVGYDWSADRNSPAWLNRSANNMADVRTSRCAMGQDGKLYVTFEVFGGNHVLRYDPYDIMDTVRIVGGDSYFNFSNTGTETKTFVGRYDPATGNYLLGQQFTARLTSPPYRGNTIFARNGNVAADVTGRVYLTGKSASGLPQTIDYQPGEYTGGAYVLVLSPNLATREICVRLTNGEGRFVAVQNQHRWIYGGSTSNPLYQAHPPQTTSGVQQEGFFSVIDQAPCPTYHTLGRTYTNAPIKYEASEEIKSQHQLNAGQRVTYDARRAVILEKGFEAKSGSVFTVQIDGCDGR